VIGYLGRDYSKRGSAFRMGISKVIVKARFGVVIARLVLKTRATQAHVAPHFA
jgi:hypothetical protein